MSVETKERRKKKQKFEFVGKSVPRVDALEKVTGAAVYTDDIDFGPRVLYAKLVRSTRPHAKIKSIDFSKALKVPGVRAVVEGKEFPYHIGLYMLDRTIYAVDKVRYIGDPVAGVAAETEEAAEEAARLVEVEYEDLTPYFDPIEALQADKDLIHPDLGSYERAPFIFPEPGTNISNHFKVRHGDIDKAFEEADYVFEAEYRAPQIQHSPIETHICAAKQDSSGRITFWTSSQSPFAQRNLLAKAFKIPYKDLEVITPYVGGGFGSKAGISTEACVIPLAMKARGYVVKLRITREEELYTTFVRQGIVARLRFAVRKDGRIIGMRNEYFFDGGAYTEYGSNVIRAAGYSGTGPYEVPNVWVDSYCVYTNHPVGGPMRGFGMPEIHWAIEQHIDTIARELGIDPIEIRLKNGVKTGSTLLTGGKMHRTGFKECLRNVAKLMNWPKKGKPSAPNKVRGIGVAAMWKAPAMPPNAASSAILKFNEDGTLDLLVSGMEIGQGTMTAMAQIAAEELGVTIDKIKVHTPLTGYSPYEWQTVASRLTWSMGNAVLRAARNAKQQILRLVAAHWGVKTSDLDIKDNAVFMKRQPEKRVNLDQMVIYGIYDRKNLLRGGPIMGIGNFIPPDITPLDKETGQGKKSVVHFTTGVQAVEIEIDTETGKIQVLKVAGSYDVGKAINPALIQGQFEGGVVQGMSSALFESLILKNGRLLNNSFVDYKIATAMDIPNEFLFAVVESMQKDGPFGARGVGEHTMVPTAPAIANAVYDALGIRVHSMPITAEKVRLALKNKQTDVV